MASGLGATGTSLATAATGTAEFNRSTRLPPETLGPSDPGKAFATTAAPRWEREAMRGAADALTRLPEDGRGCVVLEATGGPFHVVFNTASFTLKSTIGTLFFKVGQDPARGTPTTVHFGDAAPWESDSTSRHDALCPGEAATRTYWFSYDRQTGLAAMGVGRRPGLGVRVIVQDRTGHRNTVGVTHVCLSNWDQAVRVKVLAVEPPPAMLCCPEALTPTRAYRRFPACGLVARLPGILAGDEGGALLPPRWRRPGQCPAWLSAVMKAQQVLATSAIAHHFALVPLDRLRVDMYELVSELSRTRYFGGTASAAEYNDADGKDGTSDGRDAGADRSRDDGPWVRVREAVKHRTARVMESAPWTLWNVEVAAIASTLDALVLRPSTSAGQTAARAWQRTIHLDTGLPNGLAASPLVEALAALEALPRDDDADDTDRIMAAKAALSLGSRRGESKEGGTRDDEDDAIREYGGGMFVLRLAHRMHPLGHGEELKREVERVTTAITDEMENFGTVELCPPELASFSDVVTMDDASTLARVRGAAEEAANASAGDTGPGRASELAGSSDSPAAGFVGFGFGATAPPGALRDATAAAVGASGAGLEDAGDAPHRRVFSDVPAGSVVV